MQWQKFNHAPRFQAGNARWPARPKKLPRGATARRNCVMLMMKHTANKIYAAVSNRGIAMTNVRQPLRKVFCTVMRCRWLNDASEGAPMGGCTT